MTGIADTRDLIANTENTFTDSHPVDVSGGGGDDSDNTTDTLSANPEPLVSDGNARYSTRIKTKGSVYPLTIEVGLLVNLRHPPWHRVQHSIHTL